MDAAVSVDIVKQIGIVAGVVSGVLQGIKKLAPQAIKGNVAIGINIALSFLLTLAQHPSADPQFLLTALGAAFAAVGIHSFLRPVSGVDEAQPTINNPEAGAESVGHPAWISAPLSGTITATPWAPETPVNMGSDQTQHIQQLQSQLAESAVAKENLEKLVAEYVAELAQHEKITQSVAAIQSLDINKISPLDAFNAVVALKNHAKAPVAEAPKPAQVKT